MSNQIKKLEKYCTELLIEYKVEDEVFEVDNKFYQIITDERKLFDEELNFIESEELEEDLEGYVYEFGGRWYLQKRDEKLSLSELKNIGTPKQKLPTKTFLGIRSGYELMNGVGQYKEWVEKAKFLGVETLGICEKNTLSGVLSFQSACKSAGIKSIIGMTTPVSILGSTVEIKLYVENYQGWLNLLKMNTVINVDKDSSVELDFLLENREGLVIVVDPKSMDFSLIFEEIDFYQLDTVRYEGQDRDKDYLDNLANFIQSELEPISITDAFYIENGDYHGREALWNISKAYDYRSKNQFFKNKDKYAEELISLFEPGNKSWVKLFKKAVANEADLVEVCNYSYDTSTRHLPKYEMTEEESRNFETNEQLFLHLIKKGFREKLDPKESKKYIERLKMEIEVLKNGQVIDYFLSLYDIIQYARRENMMTGVGRGSAGGSLVAYLLDIIRIDPLEFGLLFERFLNAGRMGAMVECPLYVLEMEDGSSIELVEGELVRIKRNGKETAVLIHDLKAGDEIIRLN